MCSKLPQNIVMTNLTFDKLVVGYCHDGIVIWYKGHSKHDIFFLDKIVAVESSEW